MTATNLKPFFLDLISRRLFVVLREVDNPQATVLFVPPFAEEMNKSRRQMTETAHAINARGFSVITPDLFGTGDSDGEFSDATWSDWASDIAGVIMWARSEYVPIKALIATRLGCALALEGLERANASAANAIFWQPVEDGRKAMTQLLRVRVTASMMQTGVNENVENLRRRLTNGESLEIGGYQLSPQLWREIEQVRLVDLFSSRLRSLDVIELGRAGSDELSQSGARLIDAARSANIANSGQRISGEPFWISTEVVVNAALTRLTTHLLGARLGE